MSRVFRRTLDPPVAIEAEGMWITDNEGRRYLDAGGSAIVSGIGHGDPDVIRAMEVQAAAVEFVHATQFTSPEVEAYAAELAEVVPVDDPFVYPTSGGAEGMETAFKLARAFHLARGEPDREVIIARHGSYHGNSLGALDASDRPRLRRPYEPWLGRTRFVPAVYEYRCPNADHPEGCGSWHADRLEAAIAEIGAGRVAAFVAEPISGATLGAAVPPDDYWPKVAEVCRRHGVLLIADEVMTGFGRTGAWFAVDHWGVRPDLLVAAKGASSGYWPLGLCVASGELHETVGDMGFIHGFTFSHHPIGAAVGRAVLRKLRRQGLVEASRIQGKRLLEGLSRQLAAHPSVGDVRGRGLLVGIELVADRSSKQAFPRSERILERLLEAGQDEGLLLYGSTGCADRTNGDLLLLGPPLIVSETDVDLIVDRTARALEVVFE